MGNSRPGHDLPWKHFKKSVRVFRRKLKNIYNKSVTGSFSFGNRNRFRRAAVFDILANCEKLSRLEIKFGSGGKSVEGVAEGMAGEEAAVGGMGGGGGERGGGF